MSAIERDANPAIDQELLGLSERIGTLLRERGWTCGTAESCTGGGIAHALTSIPGSSDYVQGGIVAYSNEIKQKLLDVSPDTLRNVGAVSAECGREMVLGVRRALDVDLGLSSTGIAGPGGATTRKPVGLVYIGVATSEQIEVRELHLTGDRQSIMRAAVIAALELSLAVLLNGADAGAPETGA
jgi:PncC family amidohydrolase